MGYEDQKYVTALTIMNRIARIHKTKQFTIEDIVEWCAECETEVINEVTAFRRYHLVKRIVDENNLALLPCNVWRLVDVCTSGDTRYNYDDDGVYLHFSPDQTYETDENGDNVVFLNYWGIAIDNLTGWPLIKRGHELACEAYSVWKLYYEDFLNSKVNATQWQYVDQQKIIQCEAAKNGVRFMNPKELERYMNIVMNSLPRWKELPLMHLNSL